MHTVYMISVCSQRSLLIFLGILFKCLKLQLNKDVSLSV